jgi:hypothetical protein
VGGAAQITSRPIWQQAVARLPDTLANEPSIDCRDNL